MSEAAPAKAVASTSASGDVRNHGMKPNTYSKDDYSQHSGNYRGGYKPHGQGQGGRGRGAKFNHNGDDREPYRHTNQRGARHDVYYRDKRQPNTRDRIYQKPYHSIEDALKIKSSNLALNLDNIYDTFNKDHSSGIQEKNNDKQTKQRGQSNEKGSAISNSAGQENRGQRERDRSNDSRRAKSYNNQSNKKDLGSFKKFQNGSRESLYNGPNSKKPRRPMEEHNPNKSGPPRKQFVNKHGGGRDSKFNNRKCLLNEISLVLVQAKSYPELFSYEQLCQELLQQTIEKTEKQNDAVVKEPVERKKAPFLKNGVKLVSSHNRGQGNIPNEYKRRKKPSRMTILNRIRKGIPVDSDDDDFEEKYVLNKHKTGAEKKQKVLEVIQRLSRERTEQGDKQVMPEKENVAPHVEINEYNATYSKSDQAISLKNTKHNHRNSESSFDDSEDEKDQRKSEAQKLSTNFSNDLANYMNRKAQEPKDLDLSDLKNIIQARSAPDNNSEESSSKMDEERVINQLENLGLKDINSMTNKVSIECKLKDYAKATENNNSPSKTDGLSINEEENTPNKEEEPEIDVSKRINEEIQKEIVKGIHKTEDKRKKVLESIQRLSRERTEQVAEQVMPDKDKAASNKMSDSVTVEVKDNGKPTENNVSFNKNSVPTDEDETSNIKGEPVMDITNKSRSEEEIHPEKTVTGANLQYNINSEISSDNVIFVEPQMGSDEIGLCRYFQDATTENKLKRNDYGDKESNMSVKMESNGVKDKEIETFQTSVNIDHITEHFSNNGSTEISRNVQTDLNTNKRINEDKDIENVPLKDNNKAVVDDRHKNKTLRIDHNMDSIASEEIDKKDGIGNEHLKEIKKNGTIVENEDTHETNTDRNMETYEAMNEEDNGITVIVNGKVEEFNQTIDKENQEEKTGAVEDGDFEYEEGEEFDEESGEESESDDEDEIDDDKMKLLRALTEELEGSGKDASNQAVIELLQEKMKLLALNNGGSEAQDAAQSSRNKHSVTSQNQHGKELSSGAGRLEKSSEVLKTPADNKDAVIVCDDTSDDDDDESEDDDDFPVVIVKDNKLC